MGLLLLAIAIVALWALAAGVYYIYMRGALYGARAAYAELLRGAQNHYGKNEDILPVDLPKYLAAADEEKRYAYFMSLMWNVGDEVGVACWLAGRDDVENTVSRQ